MAVGGPSQERHARDRLMVAVVVAVSVFIDLRLLGLLDRLDLPAGVTAPMSMLAAHATEIALAVLALGVVVAASRAPLPRKG